MLRKYFNPQRTFILCNYTEMLSEAKKNVSSGNQTNLHISTEILLKVV